MSQSNRTKTALDESRMLMLGAQVLLGFQFQAPFQNAFSAFSQIERILELAVLVLMLIVVALLIAPSARHRIVYNGSATPSLDRFITRISAMTLFPFAVALGLDIGIAGARIMETALGVGLGVATVGFATAFWYAPSLRARRLIPMATSDEKTPLDAKIDYVLTEARVVLPGAQAMLGFQLAIVFTTAFAALSPMDKAIHGIALCSITISTILLITLPAYHRLAYQGRNESEFHRTASRLLLFASVSLAIGLAGDTYVVSRKIIDDLFVAAALCVLTMLMLGSLWFAWPFWHRSKARQSGDWRQVKK